MSTWSSSTYDGENPQSVGHYRSQYTRDTQAWIDELVAARVTLERRVRDLKKAKKEQAKKLGVGFYV